MTLEKFIKIQKYKILGKIIVFLSFLIFFFYKMDLDYLDYLDGFRRLTPFFKAFSYIEFSDYKIVIYKMIETFITAFSSTLLGVLFATLISPFLTRYFIKNLFINKILNFIFLTFRTVPALVLAAILVGIIGSGSFTGFISLFIITFFYASKFLKEYLEEIPKEKIIGFSSMGISRLALFRSCIFPLSKPYIISLFFLTLESSIRGASVLGMVGAGGIGEELWKNLSYLRYDKVAFIILVLLLFIFFTDSLSWFFRKKDDYIKTSTKEAYYLSKNIRKIFVTLLIIVMFLFVRFLYSSVDNLSLSVIFERTFKFFEKLKYIDFSYYQKGIPALFDSFMVAIFATVFAAPTAIIISYFASSNISSIKTSFIFKGLINFIRTFPPVIVAIIFFSGFGPGLISGFFALYIYTTGILTKIYVDILESKDIDYGIYGKSIGLKKFYIYLKLWVPSTYTNFISVLLYRFESNMKNSSVLGMVGAGGIGELLINNIGFRNWEKVWLLLILLIITILLIENFSIFIRKKINS